MSSNKGGRPAHHAGEVKKAAIAVRTAPSIRDALKKAADEAGRSVTQEVEARLSASLEVDGGQRSPETEQLLNRIAGEIADIEGNTKKRWHKDRKTAGAVLEMLDQMPKRWIRTDDPYEDEFVKEAWDALYAIQLEREQLTNYLKETGFVLTPINMGGRGMMGGRGLFNSPYSNAHETPNALAGVLKGRWSERHQLERLEVSKAVKVGLEVILNQLEAIDEREKIARKKYHDAMDPFVEAELEGRKTYRQSKERARAQAMQNGEQINYGEVI